MTCPSLKVLVMRTARPRSLAWLDLPTKRINHHNKKCKPSESMILCKVEWDQKAWFESGQRDAGCTGRDPTMVPCIGGLGGLTLVKAQIACVELKHPQSTPILPQRPCMGPRFLRHQWASFYCFSQKSCQATCRNPPKLRSMKGRSLVGAGWSCRTARDPHTLWTSAKIGPSHSSLS